MKQTIRKTVYEFKKDQLTSITALLGVLRFKGIKFFVEEHEETIKIVIPEEK